MTPKEHAEQIATVLKGYGYLSGGDIVIDTIAAGIRTAMLEAAEEGGRAMQNELAIGISNMFANELQAKIVEGAIRVLNPTPIARQVVDSEVGVDHNE